MRTSQRARTRAIDKALAALLACAIMGAPAVATAPWRQSPAPARAATTMAGLHTLATTSMAGPNARAATSIAGLHVQGNQIVNGAGQAVRLLGVDRSGTEYACIQGWGIFDGPSDATSVQAIASWYTDAVRVPLNEDCWLGINGAPPPYSGANYQQAIVNYVNLLNQNGLVAILDLHWNAPGSTQATGQQPMPDQDHAPAFWSSVATTFKNNSAVVFDLYNEPYPDSNQDTAAAWQCWRDGGTCAGVSFQAAGMQELVNTVRNTGATNVIMLGGVQYSGTLSQWLAYKPSDPTGNLAASWHSYNFSACNNSACWNSQVAPVAQQVPLVAGEIGENDCADGYINALMPWLDGYGASYLGWTWDTWDCASGPALITDYSGTPTNFGVGLKNHLAALASNPTPTPTNTPTQPTPTATATGTPTQPSPTPTSTPAASGGYSFEDGTTDGWQVSGAPFTGAANSTVRAYSGTHSLAVTAAGFGNSAYPWVWVVPPPSSLGPYATITAHVWAPSRTQLSAQLFVSDAAYVWHMAGYTALRAGRWTTLTYTVPGGVSLPLYGLGVQFLNNSATSFSGSLYLDAISW